MKAKFFAMKGNEMSGRSKLINLGKEFPKLTEKERDALIMVHPYLDGLTYTEAARELGISRDAVQSRLRNIYRKIPWLQEDMAKKRKEENGKKESLRRPLRFGDMSGIESDGDDEYFYGDKIIQRF